MMTNRKMPKGILGFPITPFDKNGKIDEKVLSANIEYLVREGTTAIFIGCGSGEFQSLSQVEYTAILELAVSVVDGRVPVFSGVGGNLATALEHSKISQGQGVDGYLLMPPYLVDSEQEGLYQYVRTIVEDSDLNAVLYNRGNAIYSLETLQKLLELQQVTGFKDGNGKMDTNIEYVQTIGDRLEWYNGMPFAEVTMPAYYNIGFTNYSSAISNYIPHISRLFFDAIQKGDQELVSDLYQTAILPINRVRKQRKGYAVSLIKAGMEIMGLPAGQKVRAPLTSVEPEHYKQLETILKNVLEKYPVEDTVRG
jgi:5-dehydro-4-deoxyglucarate dehydratase